MLELDYLYVVSKTTKSLLIFALCITIGTLLLLSVSIWGAWWRLDEYPTPEEWSALFTAGALIGVFFAWRQLKQVDESNRSLQDTNERSLLLGQERLRPRVIVDFEVTRFHSASPQARIQGAVHLVVKNVGTSDALDVSVAVSPSFELLDGIFKPEFVRDRTVSFAKAFDGSDIYKRLGAGKDVLWPLGEVGPFFDHHAYQGKSWVFTITYYSPVLRMSFEEEFPIDFDQEKRATISLDPLNKISSRLGSITTELKGIAKKLS